MKCLLIGMDYMDKTTCPTDLPVSDKERRSEKIAEIYIG